MKRQTMIPAIVLICATSLATAPAFAQQQPLLDAKAPAESAPRTSGALPGTPFDLGQKGSATTESGQHTTGNVKSILPPTGEPK
jgi:hypothetical protein